MNLKYSEDWREKQCKDGLTSELIDTYSDFAGTAGDAIPKDHSTRILIARLVLLPPPNLSAS
jgi:hypothetical protein